MSKRDDDLARELRDHLELEAEERRARGLSPDAAARAAHAAFGNVMLTKERTREMWGWSGVERLWQDIRYGLRSFRRSPGFVSVALLSLALGIGATTALFSVVYGVLIAPYPYAKPEQIWAPAVLAQGDNPHNWHQYSRSEILEIRKLPTFASVMATDPAHALLSGDRGITNETVVRVTGNAFNFIGVKALLGRGIQPFDVDPGGDAAPVVVLSYGFWKRVFSGSPTAIGAKIVLDDIPHTVIGVMPPRFGWFTNTGVWLPLAMNLNTGQTVNTIMRLAPGVSPERAAASLHALNQRLAARDPDHFPKTPYRTSLLNYMDVTSVSTEMVSSLHLLLAAVGFLLLIACANVASLQLARTTARFREIAMRLSIGAARSRIIRQLLTESLMLSLAGGVAGVLFAIGLTRAIVVLMPQDFIPNEARVTVNLAVLAFSFAISVLTGILFGLAPAIQCTRPNLTDALKEGSRASGAGHTGRRMRGALVVVEVALAVILLAGASLSVRGFAQLLHTDPGFQPERTLMMDVPLPRRRYVTLDQRNNFATTLLHRVANLPGVEAAAIGNGALPFGGAPSSYSIDGTQSTAGRNITIALISSAYTRTLGIPVKRGRPLTEAEVARGEHVALINETAAKLWPAGEDPVGRTITADLLLSAGGALPPLPSAVVKVVGIIGDTRNAGLRGQTTPGVYVPYTLIGLPTRILAIRTQGEPTAMLNSLRAVVRQMDPKLPLGTPVPFEEVLGGETVQPRFTMALLACFALLGVALATAGIYSVISCDVSQKVHEIGVRVALGASRSNVISLVLKKSARMVGTGLAAGLVGSAILERISRFEFFGAVTLDWLSALAVVAVLASVALIASWAPARRAARMHPVEALRYEA